MPKLALSEGLAENLQSLMRPENAPLEITSEERLMVFLELLVNEYKEWGTIPGSKPLSRFLDEFRNRECRNFVITWLGEQLLLRDIRTATLYVTTTLASFPPAKHLAATRKVWASTRKVWLKERHLENGVMVDRKHRNSMSEKLLPGETFRDAAIRALRQELSIDPAPHHLKPPYFFSVSDYPMISGTWTQNKKEDGLPDIRDTPRYPGLVTRNELEHFFWVMPEEYYRVDGYQEPKTNHYFSWEEVSVNDMADPSALGQRRS